MSPLAHRFKSLRDQSDSDTSSSRDLLPDLSEDSFTSFPVHPETKQPIPQTPQSKATFSPNWSSLIALRHPADPLNIDAGQIKSTHLEQPSVVEDDGKYFLIPDKPDVSLESKPVVEQGNPNNKRFSALSLRRKPTVSRKKSVFIEHSSAIPPLPSIHLNYSPPGSVAKKCSSWLNNIAAKHPYKHVEHDSEVGTVNNDKQCQQAGRTR
jgi:hypothetical protein